MYFPFFFVVCLYFLLILIILISAVIEQNINPNAELIIPIGAPIREATAGTKLQILGP